ncbi:hypothetical protein NBRC116592_20650 [Colwellia sp. KU-HH00111]
MIKLIPSGISTKNFYDHKEVGYFLQGKKPSKHCKNRIILIFITIALNLSVKLIMFIYSGNRFLK